MGDIQEMNGTMDSLSESGLIRHDPWMEYIAPVPMETFTSMQGLSFDCGGSALKVAFKPKSKNHCVGHSAQRKGIAHIHLIHVTKSSYCINDVFTYVKERADVTEGTTLHCTGYDTVRIQDKIKEIFQNDIVIEDEMSCSSAALHFVLTHPDLHFTDWILPPNRPIEIEQLNKLTPFFHKNRHNGMSLLPEYERSYDQSFPCLLLMMGSGVGTLKVEKDHWEMLYATGNGVRSLEGLGCYITGTKNAIEMVELAEAGKERNIDEFTEDIFCPAKNDNIPYEEQMNFPSRRSFPYGKLLRKGNADCAKPEDLARSLVLTTVQSIAMETSLASKTCEDGINTLFICGGFASFPFVRESLTKELMMQALVTKYNTKKSVVRPYYVRFPAFLGVFGAMLFNTLPSLPTSQNKAHFFT